MVNIPLHIYFLIQQMFCIHNWKEKIEKYMYTVKQDKHTKQNYMRNREPDDHKPWEENKLHFSSNI